MLSFVSIWLDMHLIRSMCSMDFGHSVAIAQGMVLCLRLLIDIRQQGTFAPSLVRIVTTVTVSDSV